MNNQLEIPNTPLQGAFSTENKASHKVDINYLPCGCVVFNSSQLKKRVARSATSRVPQTTQPYGSMR